MLTFPLFKMYHLTMSGDRSDYIDAEVRRVPRDEKTDSGKVIKVNLPEEPESFQEGKGGEFLGGLVKDLV